MVEQADGLDAIAGVQRRLHQRALSLLVGRIERDQALPKLSRPKQVGVALLQLAPRIVEPIHIEVVRQELTAIEVGGALVCAAIATAKRSVGCGLEQFNVDLQFGVRRQRDDIVGYLDQLVSPEQPPRKMEGLTQVGAGRVDIEVRPEGRHGLLSMDAMSRRDRE
jgi:hypothetical protein